MFPDTKDGQTQFCNHETANKSGVCDECFGHDLKWFMDRIGKRVYRDVIDCSCKTCKDIGENGLIIRDENHARYLHMIWQDMGVVYRDNK